MPIEGNVESSSENPLLDPAGSDGPVVTSDIPLLYKKVQFVFQ